MKQRLYRLQMVELSVPKEIVSSVGFSSLDPQGQVMSRRNGVGGLRGCCFSSRSRVKNENDCEMLDILEVFLCGNSAYVMSSILIIYSSSCH